MLHYIDGGPWASFLDKEIRHLGNRRQLAVRRADSQSVMGNAGVITTARRLLCDAQLTAKETKGAREGQLSNKLLTATSTLQGLAASLVSGASAM